MLGRFLRLALTDADEYVRLRAIESCPAGSGSGASRTAEPDPGRSGSGEVGELVQVMRALTARVEDMASRADDRSEAPPLRLQKWAGHG